MVNPGKGDYVTIGSGPNAFVVFFDKDSGDAIHLITDSPEITDEHGEKPGLRTVVSSNPKSANYNPPNFNRLARLLRKYGKTAPEDVPLHPRQLAKRPQVTALLLGSGTHDPGPADPKQFGWSICPHCSAVVLDVDDHLEAAHGIKG